jgi:ATP-dependent DNA helicase 2 subunit 1
MYEILAFDPRHLPCPLYLFDFLTFAPVSQSRLSSPHDSTCGMDDKSTLEERHAALYGFSTRDASMFLLDWRWAMVQPMTDCGTPGAPHCTEDVYVPLACALRAIIDVMKKKIIASDTDLIGVIAFGAAVAGQLDSSSKITWPGVRVILPLEKPSAEAIVKLVRLAKRIERGEVSKLEPGGMDERKRADPDFAFGKDDPVELQNALWAVRYQFSRRKVTSSTAKSVYNRCRVYLFTNDDDPSRGNVGIKRLTARNAKDLADAGIMLDVTFLKSREDQVFDASKFYEDIVFEDGDEWHGRHGAISASGISSLESLQSAIRRKEIKKRATARMTLSLGEGLVIGVSLYSMVRKAGRPQKVKVRRDDMKRLHQVRTTYCDATGESLQEKDVRVTFSKLAFMRTNKSSVHAQIPDENTVMVDDVDNHVARDSDCGNVFEDVWAFKTNELIEIASMGIPGLALYGFRDISAFRQENMLKPPSFIYPDEISYNGSSKLFAALHRSMLVKKKMAIASWSKAQGTSGPRFVVLLAQPEILNSEGMQIQPPGMRLFVLPYKNDVHTGWREELRKLKNDRDALSKNPLDNVDEGEALPGLSVATALVTRLTQKRFSCKSFASPDLQRFYAGIEWEAGVSEGEYQPADDLLEPDDEALRRRAIVHVKGREGKDPDGAVDLLATFRRITLGDEFQADEVAEQFGTRSGMVSLEKAERRLKRNAESDAKRAAALDVVDMDEFEQANRRGELPKITNTRLKEFCLAVGLKTTGPKSALVDRIAEYFDPNRSEVI